ncbi:MAG: DNA topoisomerase family protein, partial [Planctomycetota bacterium]
ITRRGIKHALENPRDINDNLVNAQQARRILDRIVGYKLSPLLWEKVAKNETEAMEVVAHLKAAAWSVAEVEQKRKTDRPPPPYKTSTLQQAAANTLRFSARRTMRVTQQLYEGVAIGEQGHTGLVTYMRTDSFNVSQEALSEVRALIPATYGEQYLPEKPHFYKARDKDQFRLYELIWKRFVASQMAPAVFDVTDVAVAADPASDEAATAAPSYELRCQGKVMVFDGYQKVNGPRNGDVELPPLTTATKVEPVGDPTAEQNFTKPPARFTEATLVRTLERDGIGRPSTYASIISTIQDRGYVYQEERKFHASELGELVTDLLRPYFPEILDVAFTAGLESRLDDIEEGDADWVTVLRDFYRPFADDIEKALDGMRNLRKEPDQAERQCPTCGKDMVYRWRGASKYLACPDYPDCRTTIALNRDGTEKVRELTEHKCPKCESPMILRSGRFGKFLACSAYPNCRSTMSVDKEGNPILPEKWPDPCPECGKEMIVRRGRRGRFVACTGYPECKKTIPYKKKEQVDTKA